MMREHDSAGRINYPQILLIGIVIAIIGLFLANNAFLAIGGSVSATPKRMIKQFCYDTDNGFKPDVAGATIIIALDNPILTHASNAQLAGNVTSVTFLGSTSEPLAYQILLQPPGVTGSGLKGKMWVFRDLGESAEQFDTDEVVSEPNPSDQAVAAPSATLTEYGCYSDTYSTKRYTGKTYSSDTVDFLWTLGGQAGYPGDTPGWFPYFSADYLTG